MKLRITLLIGISVLACAGLVELTAARLGAQTKPGSTYVPETEHIIPSLDGAALYVSYCAVCHGKLADGRGPMAPVLRDRVPDLTQIRNRNGGIFPFERVERIIDGSESAGLGHGTRTMPLWGPLFSQVAADRDYGKVRIYNVTKYLESIQK